MAEKYQRIPVNLIKDDRYQSRSFLNDDAFYSLVESIKDQGLLQPINIRSEDGQYVCMAGHRRLAAVKYIGWDFVPCLVLDGELLDPWAVSFHENVYRKDMTPIEEAAFVVDCMEKGGLTAEKLSGLIRKSVSWIRERVNICSWPLDVSQAVHEGKMSVSAAGNLAQILDDQARRLLVDYAVENGATARTTAAWLQGFRANEPLEDPGSIEPVPPGQIQGPVEPYAPCVICDEKFKMVEMTYLPICAKCQDEVIAEVRKQLILQKG